MSAHSRSVIVIVTTILHPDCFHYGLISHDRYAHCATSGSNKALPKRSANKFCTASLPR